MKNEQTKPVKVVRNTKTHHQTGYHKPVKNPTTNYPKEIFTGEGGVIFRKYNPTCDVKGFLDGLKEVLLEDCDMKRKPEMMAKVKELEALLKAEQEDFDKGE